MSLITEFPDRLTTLCTGQSGLRGLLQVDTREPAGDEIQNQNSKIETSPVLDFIASDETLDRYDEIISVSGWNLENYRRNPVFQNAHQYGDIIFTLGKALVTEVRAGAPSSESQNGLKPHLFQRVLFATDVNPMARIAYGLYKGKFLNAVSVGFIPLKWENGDGTQEPTRGRSVNPMNGGDESQARAVRGCGGKHPFRRRYLEQELLEVSAVGIPANPDALQLGLKAGVIERADLRDTVDLLRQIVGAAAQPMSEQHAVLALVRELREVLRR